ncbi:MAG: flagellar hook-associated protein FlgL [Planctomycetota bacterium]
MPLRITQQSVNRSTLSDITSNLRKMQDIQEKLSSGKQINRPSDDPSATRKILGLKTKNFQILQFLNNTATAKENMNYTSDALETIHELLSKVKSLVVQASSDTLGQSERQIIASEINQLTESVIQFSNTTDSSGRYVFSGTKTQTLAFTATRDSVGKVTAVSYNGNNEAIKYQIGSRTQMQVNLPGGAFFQDNQFFSTLISMRDALGAQTFDHDAFLQLKKTLDTATDTLSTEITKFGAKLNRLEITTSRLENSQVTLKEMISSAEDADVAALIMDLKNQETVLQSSLDVGGRIIQPTLLNFLR